MAQVMDGHERQTFVYDVHGEEQECVINRMRQCPILGQSWQQAPQPSSGMHPDGHFSFPVPLLGYWLVVVIIMLQWLKKLSQCLAVSYHLTCNTMTSVGITLKQIHLIVYHISF
jgi:hypothetical protein